MLLFLVACAQTETPQEKRIKESKQIESVQYARHFKIGKVNGQEVIWIHNPWQKDSWTAYYIPQKKIDRIIPLSASFFGFFKELGLSHKICAVESENFVFDTLILSGINEQRIKQLGNSASLSAEQLLILQPDLVFYSGSPDPPAALSAAGQKDVAIIPILDWQETHPLGKAEWIRVFSHLCGQGQAGDSIFEQIKTRYLALEAELMQKLDGKNKPSVLLGYNYQGTWYVPGGQSYMARLMQSAGMDYAFKDNPEQASVGMSYEKVVGHFLQADIWLHPGLSRSDTELLSLDKRYARFIAFQNRRVFNNNLHENAKGGNEFWETSPVRPDIFLLDLASIAHPDLFPEHKLYFYKNLFKR